MKSGTSTLAFQLGQHPEIFVADHEVHFFDNELNYSKGIKYYEKEFADWNNEKAIGEKTPAYCLKSEYAARIASVIPKVKLIWIFRNPTERTYSEYWHVVRKGTEKRTFEELIFDNDKSILEPKKSRYIERSMYYRHVQNFLEFFPKKNMYFTTFEKYTNNPQQIVSEIFDFLKVDLDFIIDPSIKKNETILPKNRSIQFILDKLRNIGKKYVNSDGYIANFYRKTVKLNQKKINGYPKMNSITKKKLDDYFVEKNQLLMSLTGLNFSEWEI